ncbi:TlpA disulfide reductase family protein [Atopobium sp. oral taxon 199]|uniref:TlpA family protein disulfide reductase n=1 Tax=Atopobium sp. oral taxon 199 TaxID=712156 RepID=UPI00034E59D6|nr:TlpA disulfide reductase family protein [Atopobium sp. oral taxon 199]EPD78548.1 hypothetical protein HMPREF1527_00871 [Atopobium sp. oral taxon 199 str. F0494]
MKKFAMKPLVYVLGVLMAFALVGCNANAKKDTGSTPSASTSEQQSSSSDVPPEAASKLHLKDGDTFPTLKATDITSGETYDNEMFKKNKVTVLSFWFNGCTGCIKEMPLLQELADKYKDKGVNVLGVNAEAAYTDDAKKEAQNILTKQGVTYGNIALDPKSDAGKVIEGLTAFPTTMVIDQNGKLVGDPITGGAEKLDGSELQKRVEQALSQSK